MPLRRLRPYKFRGLLWAALGFIGLTTLAMGYTVWQLRSDAIDDAYKETGNIATVLSEQIAQTARSIDLVLTDMQDRILAFDVNVPDDLRRVLSGENAHAMLKSRVDRFPSASPWYAAVHDGGGRFRSAGKFIPDVRLVSVRLVSGYPLATSVGVTESSALATWRQRSAFIAVGTLLAMICSFFLLSAIANQ